MINIQKMMQQAQEVQFKLQEMQEKLKDIDVNGESGGGMVKVTMTGRHEVKQVRIDPSVLSDDADMLEDLLAAAVNDANRRVEKTTAEKMGQFSSGLNLPAGLNFPF